MYNQIRREVFIMKKMSIRRVSEKILAGLIVLAVISLISLSAAAEDTIKITYCGPLSGPLAQTGNEELDHLQFMADKINAKGGVLGGKKLEVISYDDKFSVAESQVIIKKMADKGLHFVVQGAGSHISHAIIGAIKKLNRRNPDQAILFLNMATQDPALTNEKCSFWHFRFFPNTAMKMKAIADDIAKKPNVKKVYLINQDYSYGKSVQRAGAEMLKKKRPDIQIVGNELHPVAKIKDFMPYIAKIKASGADSVITANWGSDFKLLIKAAEESGLKVDWYTYMAGHEGTALAIGNTAKGRLKQVCDWHQDVPSPEMEAFNNAYKKKYGHPWFYISARHLMEMLAKALNKAGEPDPVKVAKALEGMRNKGATGEVYMREEDHQLIMPLFVAYYTDDARYDLGGTGMGWKTEKRIESKDVAIPATCVMKRPE